MAVNNFLVLQTYLHVRAHSHRIIPSKLSFAVTFTCNLAAKYMTLTDEESFRSMGQANSLQLTVQGAEFLSHVVLLMATCFVKWTLRFIYLKQDFETT